MAYITNEIKTVEGTSISINDSDQKIFDTIELNGNTIQNGTPTPDSPVAIQTVTGRQEIDVVGKNLFDLDWYYENNGVNTCTKELITNGIKLSFTAGADAFVGHVNNPLIDSEKISVEPSTAYTISLSSAPKCFVCYYQEDGTRIQYVQIPSTYNATSYTFTTPSNCKYITIRLGIQNSNYTNWEFTNIQLEKGSQASTYEPFKGQSYEINLGKNLFDKALITGTGSVIKYIPINVKKNTDYTLSTNSGASTSANVFLSTTNSGVTTNNNGAMIDKPRTINSGDNNIMYVGYRTDLSSYWIQLEKGSQATTYSAYKTPIELCKIGDYQDFIRKGTGKNLFDVTSEHTDFNCSSSINNNIITQTNNNPYAYSKWTIKNLKIGQIYSINCNYINKNSCTLRLNIYDSQNNLIIRTDNTTSTSGNLTLSFTANVSTIDIRIYSNNTSNINTNTVIFSDIQLEKNNQVTPYEPFGYANKWYKYKAIGKVVLDGSERINYRSYGRFDIEIPSSNGSYTILGLSNYYTYTNNWDTHQSTNGTFTIMNINWGENKCRISFKNTSYSSISDVRTGLATNNVILYYAITSQIGTPTTTEITDSELIGQLEYVELREGINNISVSSNDLSSPLKLSYYSTNNPYYDVIYSQDDKNDLKIKFNGVELADASLKCETIKRTARILPDDGSKRFSLDNFISTSLEVVLHNVNVEDIKDQVEIEIGTLIDSTNNTYQYIPLGIFNIQDTPENNNGKVTLKLRDNRVKFDFNYNAKTFIDNNYVLTTDTTYQESITYYTYNQSSNEYTQLVKGTDYNVGDTISGNIYIKLNTLTKGQMLNDICSQANVVNTIVRFNGDEDSVGIYDNTIQATTYVSYLMEQAGLIPVIDRLGRLKAVELDKLYVWRIPLSILEGYEKGEPYKIERAVYESGVIKYETSSDETLDTLYIDAANPYISNNAQVDYVLNKLQNFEIDSVKTKKVLGNPAIDPYDLIQVYNDLDGTNDVIFTTLANTSYTFNGVHRDNFSTEIGQEERTENVSINGESTFQKWAKTEINNVNSTITIQAGEIETINGTLEDTYTKGQVDTLVQTAQTGLTNTFSEAGGNNIFRNTGLWFEQNGGETKTGKNLANFTKKTTTSNGVTFSGNGSEISINGTATADTTFNLSTTLRDLLNNHLIGKNVTVSCSIASGSVSGTGTNKHIRLWFWKTDSWFWKTMDMENATNKVSFTFEEINGVRIVIANGVTATNLKIKVQIEEGSTATEYQPYYTYTNNYEFWEGPVVKQKEEKASNMNALKLQLGNLSQNQIVSSGTYTVSFKYKKLSNLSDVVAKVIINDNEYILNQLTDTEFVTGKKDSEGNYITQPLVVGDNKNIKVEFVTNLNDSCEIYDLMVNAGEVKLAYSQNQNETTTDTVNISKGITITSSDLDVTFKANADGIRTLDKSNNELTKFTDTGMTTKEAIIENTSKIVGLQFQEVNGQTWITRL